MLKVNLKNIKKFLSIRFKFNLKYNNIGSQAQSNTTDGYHRQFYSSLTTIMAKYGNLSSSPTDLSSRSKSTRSLSNTPVNVSEPKSDDDETSSNYKSICFNKSIVWNP